MRNPEATTTHTPSTPANPPPAHLDIAIPALAKRAVARSGSAVCGMLGVEQHLGLWPALAGGIGWLLASDHTGYLLRRRYAVRARARLSQWQPTSRASRRLITALRTFIGDPAHTDATYRGFVLTTLATALTWGAAFVGTGYLLAASWHNSHTPSTSPALALTLTGVILGIAAAAHHRHRHSRQPPAAGPRP